MNTAATLASLALVALAAAGCTTEPEALPTPGTSLPDTYVAPPLPAPPTPAAKDPYRSTGTWLVPSQIAYGEYRVTLTGSTGYWKLCGDLSCKLGTDGFLDNEFLQGPGILVVPLNAVSIELRGVILTPLGG